MTHTLTLPADQAPDILRAAADQKLNDAGLGQLALFDGHRPHRVRLKIAGTITLNPRAAIDIASRPLGETINLADIIDQAVIVQKTYARPLGKDGYPDPLEQTITLRIHADDDQEEAR